MENTFITITEENKILFNRAEIMKEGWKLKKEGIAKGITVAWAMAKKEKSAAEAEIQAEYKRMDEYLNEDVLIDEDVLIAEIEIEESAAYYWEQKLLDKIEKERFLVESLKDLTVDELFNLAKEVKGRNKNLEFLISRTISKKNREVA